MVATAQLRTRGHSQCAWCRRLKHKDGTPHGREFSTQRLATLGYSHGLCVECKPKLLLEAERS